MWAGVNALPLLLLRLVDVPWTRTREVAGVGCGQRCLSAGFTTVTCDISGISHVATEDLGRCDKRILLISNQKLRCMLC